jgi:endonuclease-3 related protein
MHGLLEQAYGPQHWWPAETPFEVILGAYLTQNTAWKAVERSLANLRQAGALTLDGLRSIALEDLQNLIRPSGFHTRKAPALKAFVAMLDREFSSSLDVFALRPPTPSCSTPSTIPSPWPTSISAASPCAIGSSRPHPAPQAMTLSSISPARPSPSIPQSALRASSISSTPSR